MSAQILESEGPRAELQERTQGQRRRTDATMQHLRAMLIYTTTTRGQRT